MKDRVVAAAMGILLVVMLGYLWTKYDECNRRGLVLVKQFFGPPVCAVVR